MRILQGPIAHLCTHVAKPPCLMCVSVHKAEHVNAQDGAHPMQRYGWFAIVSQALTDRPIRSNHRFSMTWLGSLASVRCLCFTVPAVSTMSSSCCVVGIDILASCAELTVSTPPLGPPHGSRLDAIPRILARCPSRVLHGALPHRDSSHGFAGIGARACAEFRCSLVGGPGGRRAAFRKPSGAGRAR